MDLKTEEGRDLVRQLLLTADIVIENFRPGVMENWGWVLRALDWKTQALSMPEFQAMGKLTLCKSRASPLPVRLLVVLDSLMVIQMRYPLDLILAGRYSVGLNAVIGIMMALQARDNQAREQSGRAGG